MTKEIYDDFMAEFKEIQKHHNNELNQLRMAKNETSSSSSDSSTSSMESSEEEKLIQIHTTQSQPST